MIAPDDDVCVCFHVPLGKLAKHARLARPRFASQMSECYGAGTGCGWCIPFLEQIFEQIAANPEAEPQVGFPPEEYVQRRQEYLKRIQADKLRG